MTIQELHEWLDTCPTHKWDVLSFDDGYVRVVFPVIDEPEEDL